MPDLPSFLMKPRWSQTEALIPPTRDHHPLGCHRPLNADRPVFDKIIQVLVPGDSQAKNSGTVCSSTTIRRRDEWINAGIIGLELADLTVDRRIIRAPARGIGRKNRG